MAFLTAASSVSALPVNLGSAGPQNWGVLQVGDGTITQQQTSLSNPQGGIIGTVGIQQNGKLQGSGPQIVGDLYLGDNASAQFSGSYTNNQPVTGITHLGSGATVGPGSYSFNRVSDNPQALLNQARLDAIAASSAASALTPTSALQSINLKTELTLTPGIYNLSTFQLDHTTLTLSGSGSFVFNISSTFKLNSGKILLANGAIESEVLFNYTGTKDVAFSGGGNDSELHGIILALNAKVSLAPGLVVGEIISGKDISIVSGAIVKQMTPPMSVPDASSTLFLLSLATAGLLAARHRVLSLRGTLR